MIFNSGVKLKNTRRKEDETKTIIQSGPGLGDGCLPGHPRLGGTAQDEDDHRDSGERHHPRPDGDAPGDPGVRRRLPHRGDGAEGVGSHGLLARRGGHDHDHARGLAAGIPEGNPEVGTRQRDHDLLGRAPGLQGLAPDGEYHGGLHLHVDRPQGRSHGHGDPAQRAGHHRRCVVPLRLRLRQRRPGQGQGREVPAGAAGLRRRRSPTATSSRSRGPTVTGWRCAAS